MKARIKATGKIVKVFDAGNGLFEASDGETYFSQGLHFIDDEPDYWEKLKHQYAGMAMQGILANCNHQLWEREANSEGIAKRSYEIATVLVNKLKEESQCEK